MLKNFVLKGNKRQMYQHSQPSAPESFFLQSLTVRATDPFFLYPADSGTTQSPDRGRQQAHQHIKTGPIQQKLRIEFVLLSEFSCQIKSSRVSALSGVKTN